MSKLVETQNACALPGCTIKYDSFMRCLRRAQSRGYVEDRYADFVADGLRNGFTCGVDRSRVAGRRVFKNYKTATDARAAVTKAICRRVERGKSLALGPWAAVEKALCVLGITSYSVFPMGATPKKDSPDPLNPIMRPTDDHTKTGTNGITLMGFLRYALTAYEDVAWLLKQDYFMYVSDVEDAFLLLPLAPWLWYLMLFRCFLSDADKEETACVHMFGDFGTAGMPGTFYIFFVKVVVQMARSEMKLTLPMVVYVDDCGIIGPAKPELDVEVNGFQEWADDVCGVVFKWSKDREGAQRQVMIGFCWDSRSLTRSLEERKLASYVADLLRCGHALSLRLIDRQQVAGKVQRAVMCLPPGAACFLTNCFAMMMGLTIGYQRRRTSRKERQDYLIVHDLLMYCKGRGYYSYSGFAQGPHGQGDASKQAKFAGGGYVTSDGFYDWWKYGPSAARQPIDALEGDVLRRACSERGAKWKGMQLPWGIDNSAFQLSQVKGRSRAERLNEILRDIFMLQMQFGFVILSYWLCSEDNLLGDHLSRPEEDGHGEPAFLAEESALAAFLEPGAILQRHPHRGRVATFEYAQAFGRILRQLHVPMHGEAVQHGDDAMGATMHPWVATVAGGGTGRVGGAMIQQMSIPYARASIYDGLPWEYHDRVDEVADNRLAASSMAKVASTHRRWSAYCDRQNIPVLLVTDDPLRGGRLAGWVVSLMEDTDLVFASISTYVWAIRTWHCLQHQAGPVMGVMGWTQFITGVAVYTAVAAEPRKEVPFDVIQAIMDKLESEFAAAEVAGDNEEAFQVSQFALFVLTLLFTFSRAECPCPQTFTGERSFDESKHWQWKDFACDTISAHWVLNVQFKGIKQDPRCERPTARGGDWAVVGDVPDTVFSIMLWYKRVCKHGGVRDPEGPAFLARDMVRALTYAAALSDFRRYLRAVGADVTLGLHGLRVAGYNLSLHTNGQNLTVAQGGWLSEAHDRYERFGAMDVASIPARMVGAPAPADGVPTVREIRRTPVERRGVAAATATAAASDGAAVAPVSRAGEGARTGAEGDVLLPPGYVAERREAASRTYTVYRGPDGLIARSRVEAWRRHDEARVRVEEEPIGRLTPRSEPRLRAQSPPSRAARSRASPRVRFETGEGEASGSSAAAHELDAAEAVPVTEQPVEDLADATTYWARGASRRAPASRSR